VLEEGRERLTGVDTGTRRRLHPLDLTFGLVERRMGALGALTPLADRVRPSHPSPVRRFAGTVVLLDVDRESDSERRPLLRPHDVTPRRPQLSTLATMSPPEWRSSQQRVGRQLSHEHSFITWLRNSRINTALRIPYVPREEPEVSVADEHRWTIVEQLLHDTTIRRYTRIGGMFTLLFAQPLSRIVAMRTSQVTVADDTVHVAFSTLPIQMPAVLDDLIREHLDHRGKSLYASRDTGWLFPGGNPGRHLATRTSGPSSSRSASSPTREIPAPVLVDLIGISNDNAADWARLAARDWSGYIADRAR
jgi:hypothetical protein